VDRIKKLAIDIKREISFIINTKIKDPGIGFITVTDTRLSVDGKYLDIYFSTMGNEAQAAASLEALKRCSGFIKKNLCERMRLRNVPELKFIYDDSIRRGMKITEILDNISKDRKTED
jgi:ribosome-binding factor A